MATQKQIPLVKISRRLRVTYIERSIFFGLIKWQVKNNSSRLGDDLIIQTYDTDITDIYLNGKIINNVSNPNWEVDFRRRFDDDCWDEDSFVRSHGCGPDGTSYKIDDIIAFIYKIK